MIYHILCLFLLLFYSQSTPCCISCEHGKAKYFSIDNRFDHCGESCIYTIGYPIFKLFEPGLLPATGNQTICHEKGYTIYNETVTHGFWPISITVDLYNPLKEEKTEIVSTNGLQFTLHSILRLFYRK